MICKKMDNGSVLANSTISSEPISTDRVARYGSKKTRGTKTMNKTLANHTPIAAGMPHGGLLGVGARTGALGSTGKGNCE